MALFLWLCWIALTAFGFAASGPTFWMWMTLTLSLITRPPRVKKPKKKKKGDARALANEMSAALVEFGNTVAKQDREFMDRHVSALKAAVAAFEMETANDVAANPCRVAADKLTAIVTDLAEQISVEEYAKVAPQIKQMARAAADLKKALGEADGAKGEKS